jgi:lysozyme family protein
MQYPFEILAPEYTSLLSRMVITNPASVRRTAEHLLGYKSRYMRIWAKTGVVVLLLSGLNERESGSDFHTYFGNGDPLTHKTVNVPRGRPPNGLFPDWEAGCIDALHLDRLDQVAHQPGGWTWARTLYEGETFNGFGYRPHNIHSPYLWAGSNIYDQGPAAKFDSDGHFALGIRDTQLGIAPIMATMLELDPSLSLIDGFPGVPLIPRMDHEMIPSPQPIPPGLGADDPVHDTKWIQASLNELDKSAELKIDGIWGRRTRTAVTNFQDQHGLEADGVAGPKTIAGIEEALQAEVS